MKRTMQGVGRGDDGNASWEDATDHGRQDIERRSWLLRVPLGRYRSYGWCMMQPFEERHPGCAMLADPQKSRGTPSDGSELAATSWTTGELKISRLSTGIQLPRTRPIRCAPDNGRNGLERHSMDEKDPNRQHSSREKAGFYRIERQTQKHHSAKLISVYSLAQRDTHTHSHNISLPIAELRIRHILPNTQITRSTPSAPSIQSLKANRAYQYLPQTYITLSNQPSIQNLPSKQTHPTTSPSKPHHIPPRIPALISPSTRN